MHGPAIKGIYIGPAGDVASSYHLTMEQIWSWEAITHAELAEAIQSGIGQSAPIAASAEHS